MDSVLQSSYVRSKLSGSDSDATCQGGGTINDNGMKYSVHSFIFHSILFLSTLYLDP